MFTWETSKVTDHLQYLYVKDTHISAKGQSLFFCLSFVFFGNCVSKRKISLTIKHQLIILHHIFSFLLSFFNYPQLETMTRVTGYNNSFCWWNWEPWVLSTQTCVLFLSFDRTCNRLQFPHVNGSALYPFNHIQGCVGACRTSLHVFCGLQEGCISQYVLWRSVLVS